MRKTIIIALLVLAVLLFLLALPWKWNNASDQQGPYVNTGQVSLLYP